MDQRPTNKIFRVRKLISEKMKWSSERVEDYVSDKHANYFVLIANELAIRPYFLIIYLLHAIHLLYYFINLMRLNTSYFVSNEDHDVFN